MRDNERIGIVPCENCKKEITVGFDKNHPEALYKLRCSECGHMFEMKCYDIMEENEELNREIYVANVEGLSNDNTVIYIELGKNDNPVYYIEKILSMFPTQQIILKNHDGSSIGQNDFYSVEAILDKVVEANQKPSYTQCKLCKEKKLNE